jgi:hypothetical protein
MTTGSRTNKNKLKILVKGRLNRDVLRTLAHEWSHEHQRTILKRKKGKDIGGKNEDEASAQASQEMKKFEKNNKSKEKSIYKPFSKKNIRTIHLKHKRPQSETFKFPKKHSLVEKS